mgnify:CR=1 FL=1
MDIFIHVPSCGGTTLWSVLRAATHRRAKRIRAGGVDNNAAALRELVRSGGSARLRVAGGHLPVGALDGVDDEARYFTFMRDPTRRLVSDFHRKLRNGKLVHGEDPDARFLEHVHLTRPAAIRFLTGLDEARVAEAYDRDSFAREVVDRVRERFVFVGFTEAFDDSLLELADVLGWDKVPSYEPRNQGGNRVEFGADTLARADALLRLEHAVHDALWADFDLRRRRETGGRALAKGSLAVRNRLRRLRAGGEHRFVKR